MLLGPVRWRSNVQQKQQQTNKTRHRKNKKCQKVDYRSLLTTGTKKPDPNRLKKLSEWWICWMYVVLVHGVLYIMSTRFVEPMTMFERFFSVFVGTCICIWALAINCTSLSNVISHLLWLASMIENFTASYIVTWICWFQAGINHKPITKIDNFSQMHWITSIS